MNMENEFIVSGFRIGWFFWLIDTEVYGQRVMEKLFMHLPFANCDVWGLVIGSLQMLEWRRKLNTFKQVIKEK